MNSTLKAIKHVSCFTLPYFKTMLVMVRSGSKNSDQNLKKLRYNSRQNNWRRDEREAQEIHTY